VTFYDRLAAMVARQLAAKGQTGAIRRSVTVGGGPSDPTGGTVTATDYACQLAVFPVDLSDIDGTTIKAGDFRVIVEPLAITPTTTDLVICTEGSLRIVDPGAFSPAGTVTHYSMVCRK
jgi:hypothetical protein